MQNYILLLSQSSFQNKGSEIIKINTKIYDNLLFFLGLWNIFYLGLELELGIILNSELRVEETQNLRTIGFGLQLPFLGFETMFCNVLQTI